MPEFESHPFQEFPFRPPGPGHRRRALLKANAVITMRFCDALDQFDIPPVDLHLDEIWRRCAIGAKENGELDKLDLCFQELEFLTGPAMALTFCRLSFCEHYCPPTSDAVH